MGRPAALLFSAAKDTATQPKPVGPMGYPNFGGFPAVGERYGKVVFGSVCSLFVLFFGGGLINFL